jgi:hypothetical protein
LRRQSDEPSTDEPLRDIDGPSRISGETVRAVEGVLRESADRDEVPGVVEIVGPTGTFMIVVGPEHTDNSVTQVEGGETAVQL